MLNDEIKKFFRGEVETTEEVLEKYSRDYSIFKLRPKAVVFPKDVGDVKKLVKFASEKSDVSLTARSAGTDMTGGPLTESVVVEFTRHFNNVKEITSDYAIVEPGVYFRDFEKELNAKNLLYPPYPASKDLCALGGMIANNSGGEKTLAYGKTEDYIEELKVVLSDGEEHVIRPLSGSALEEKLKEESFEGKLYKGIYDLIERNYDAIHAAKPDVSKNSAGYFLWNVWSPTLPTSPKRLRRPSHSYGDGADKKTFDLTKLFVGAQGTLGLITEAKLRLVKAKKYNRVAVIFLRDLKPLANLIVEILKFKPESLESYDDKTLGVALKFLPAIMKSMGGNFFKLIWQFMPEAGMVLRGGLPKMVMIAVLTSDDEDELKEKMQKLKNAAEKFGVQARLLKDEKEAQKYWTIRRQSFKLLHDKSTGKDTAPFIDDFIVKPQHLPEFLPKLNKILDKYKKDLIYTIAGHPGSGNFHIIPLMDLKDSRVRELIPKISDEVYDLVLQYKGSITAEHNDGIIRTPYLEKMYGKEIVGLFGEVKKIFDPKNIFNPGKKVGGSLEYAMERIGTDR